MTASQIARHWRDWSAVVKANGWKMKKGFLVDADQISRGRSEHHAKVWTFAEQIALRNSRAVTADDLRHGCYVAAAGRDCSHDQLTNTECNKLLALWAVLVDPDSITAMVEFQNPDQASRRGLIASILRNAPAEAYVEAISMNKHGTRNWRDLPDRALWQMCITLKERNRKIRQKQVNQPF